MKIHNIVKNVLELQNKKKLFGVIKPDSKQIGLDTCWIDLCCNSGSTIPLQKEMKCCQEIRAPYRIRPHNFYTISREGEYKKFLQSPPNKSGMYNFMIAMVSLAIDGSTCIEKCYQECVTESQAIYPTSVV